MWLILTAFLLPGIVGIALVLGAPRLSARLSGGAALVASLGALVATVAGLASDARIAREWIPEVRFGLMFAADQISGPLLLLTAGVTLLVVVHGLRHRPAGGPPGLYFGLILLVELGALATFWTRDVVVFFVAFETVLIPIWVLIHRFGDDHDPAARRDAAIRFVLYTALGSSVMVAGILGLVTAAGSSDMRTIAIAEIPPGTQVTLAALLVIGLGVKVPLFPVHSWLPPAHTIAPTGGSVLLAAVLLKMGTYGLVRLPLGLTPAGFSQVAPMLGTAGVIGIVWGGLICLVERDLKRLIAYSSVAHMGFVALALATDSALGLQAALLANVAHGLVSALLFFVVGGLKERWGSTDLTILRPALRETWPGLGFALVVGLAGTLALPGLASFWGEFLTITAAWHPTGESPRSLVTAHLIGGWFGTPPGGGAGASEAQRNLGLLRGLAIIAAFGAVLSAAYSLRVARLVWMGEPAQRDRAGDLTRTELAVMAALVIAIVVLGLLPYLVFPGPGPLPAVR